MTKTTATTNKWGGGGGGGGGGCSGVGWGADYSNNSAIRTKSKQIQ